MLYTTYLSKMKQIPEGIKKVLIVRLLPPSLSLDKQVDIYHEISLSPSKALLFDYKKNQDWDLYVKRFTKEVNTRDDMKITLNEYLAKLKKGEDICFICYEKDYKSCHRYLLALWFIEQGIEWKEI